MTRTSQVPPGLAAEMMPAVLAFVASLFARIDELERRIDDLQLQLSKTPQNSSLPPSSQHPHAKPAPKPTPSGKKPGGQHGHKKHQRALVSPERVNETVNLKPDHCRRCRERLRGGIRRRDHDRSLQRVQRV